MMIMRSSTVLAVLAFFAGVSFIDAAGTASVTYDITNQSLVDALSQEDMASVESSAKNDFESAVLPGRTVTGVTINTDGDTTSAKFTVDIDQATDNKQAKTLLQAEAPGFVPTLQQFFAQYSSSVSTDNITVASVSAAVPARLGLGAVAAVMLGCSVLLLA
ncbi:hypothetical protein DUNSADRAFT_7590 [Dunaliella salina]|uniref:Uncharacterized protein n=1 Tax=Dunaliella salina TaxID=3046 RepID=A0ABQ7GL28_DUNSA|nr:hypothetical protein DUNSADRAFT_7590 [Dunaliella salina]|eukprot:KAF5835310.1 hypothetical protein DUNSADRAFT_7590 [Dunaliella salina]